MTVEFGHGEHVGMCNLCLQDINEDAVCFGIFKANDDVICATNANAQPFQCFLVVLLTTNRQHAAVLARQRLFLSCFVESSRGIPVLYLLVSETRVRALSRFFPPVLCLFSRFSPVRLGVGQ